MNRLRIEFNAVALHFDRDYGIDLRTGWSVVIDGRVIVRMEPWLVVALWKAWRAHRVTVFERES
jgi:hypothetical protein